MKKSLNFARILILCAVVQHKDMRDVKFVTVIVIDDG
jgi:hypothetical protein